MFPYIFLASTLFLGLFLVGLSCPVQALTNEDVHETRLPNGLLVLLKPDLKSPVVSLQVWYNVGSRNEPYGKSGLAHLTEHLMFRGTKKVGPKQYARIIQKNGGQDNAFTSRDYTVYYENMASDRLSIALELEADRMTGLLIDENQFLTEKKVVQEERRLRIKDDPIASLIEEVVGTAFKSHPYKRPITGWMEDLDRLTRADFLAFYRSFYSPSQATVIVTGNFEKETLLKMMEKTFGSIPGRAFIPPLDIQEPPQEADKRIVLRREGARLPYVLLAFHVPSFPHPDAFALRVMAQILGRGKSSRLYQKLVYREQLALGANTSYSFDTKDPFLFFFQAQAMPNHSPERLEERLLGELEDWGKNPPSQEEIDRAKNQIEAEFIFSLDSVFSQGLVLGKFQGLGTWRDKDKFLPGIRSVGPEDLLRVYNTYFHGKNKTIGLLIPVQGNQGKVVSSPDRDS